MFGLSLRAWALGAGIIAVLGGLAWSHTTVYQAGRAAEQAAFLQRINKENEDAGNAAEDWRAGYRRCVDAGRVYDFETGACHD